MSTSNRVQVLSLIIQQQDISSYKTKSIEKSELASSLPHIALRLLGEELDGLESDGVITTQRGGAMFVQPNEIVTVKLTWYGWFEYAPSILGIGNVEKDISMVADYLRGKNRGVVSDELYAELKLPPLRICFALDYLEDQDQVASSATHPQIFKWIGS